MFDYQTQTSEKGCIYCTVVILSVAYHQNNFYKKLCPINSCDTCKFTYFPKLLSNCSLLNLISQPVSNSRFWNWTTFYSESGTGR